MPRISARSPTAAAAAATLSRLAIQPRSAANCAAGAVGGLSIGYPSSATSDAAGRVHFEGDFGHFDGVAQQGTSGQRGSTAPRYRFEVEPVLPVRRQLLPDLCQYTSQQSAQYSRIERLGPKPRKPEIPSMPCYHELAWAKATFVFVLATNMKVYLQSIL